MYPWYCADETNVTSTIVMVRYIIPKSTVLLYTTLYRSTYNGVAHTATGTASGVESPTPVSLTSLLDLSGTTHTNAGTYATDAWAFAGNSNYNDTNGTVSDSIAKANAVIAATPGSFTYNGTG